MSGGREWAVTLDVVCRVETCPAHDTASVVSTCAEDARQGVVKTLRYRGWKIDRRDDLCPTHAGTIPVCELCGEPTPKPYAVTRARHYTGVGYCCQTCSRQKLDESLAARFIQDRDVVTAPPDITHDRVTTHQGGTTDG